MRKKIETPLKDSIRRLFGRLLSTESPTPTESLVAQTAAPPARVGARVAAFVDMENVPAGFIEPLADLSDTFGRVCHLAVYADWRQAGNRAAWGTTLDLGGVPKQIMKTGGANSADISIVVDAMELLLLAPDVDVYVLASCDSDFVPLIQKLRARGKLVVGAAPAGRAIRPEYASAFDRFERLREPGDETPAATKPRAAQQTTAAPRAISLDVTRKTIAGLLSREGSVTAGEMGALLRDAIPGFDQRGLGFRRLSDLLRAQSDLLALRTDGSALYVTLLAPSAATARVVPVALAPPVAPVALFPEAPPPPLERGDWTRLRDYLLAVLLAPGSHFAHATDDELQSAMNAHAKRNGDGLLPATTVADIASHYPSCFARAGDGTVTATVGLVDAYRLRLGRMWEPLPRDITRKGLALLAGVLDEGDVVLADVTSRLAGAANGELTQAQARGIVNLVQKAEGWGLAPADATGKRRLRPKDWVRNAAMAEEKLDEAARARMGPFLPVDPAAMATALGANANE